MNIKQRIAGILTAIVCMTGFISGMPVSAEEETGFAYGDMTYVKIDENMDSVNDCIKITDCVDTVVSIEIPSEIGGLPVKIIGEKAFKDCLNLEKVVIPVGITTIEDQAFYSCDKLESISIPKGVVTIGYSAFAFCDRLTNAIIPEGVTTIKGSGFTHCYNLKDITIPKSLVNIGSDAFHNTEWLDIRQALDPIVTVNNIIINGDRCEGDVIIPEGPVAIGDGAFFQNTDITSIVLPDSVEKIGNHSFAYCEKLENVTIGNNVKYIDDSAFWEMPFVDNQVGVKYAGNWVIDCDSDVTEAVLKPNTVGIAYRAFWGCKALESVDIPDTVQCIGGSAFRFCDALESIEIPYGITEIEDETFYQCTGLKEVIIPDTVTRIGEDAFCSCKSLMEITIPDNVTTIEDGAFCYCRNLKEISLPENVNYIGKQAFISSENLKVIGIKNPECIIFDDAETISGGVTTVAGYWNSTAHEYALKYGKEFFSIDTPRGDANGDGYINLYDAIEIAKYIMNARDFTEEEIKSADYNNDGILNLYDVIAIAKYIMS